MSKKVLFAIATILIVVIGFFAFNSFIYQEKQAPSSDRKMQDITSYQGTLSGEYVCLPHKDQSGPQTLECAFGLKTDSGEYYAVDFSAMSQTNPGVNIGDRFQATGLITPIEMISSNHWQIYPIKGIISVTDSVKKL